MDNNVLKDVKVLLGLSDEQQDDLINTIIKITKQSLLSYMPEDTDEIPSNLQFIVTEVTVKRFNRLGAEGTSEKTVEGLKLKFNESDFNNYMNILQSDSGQSGSNGEGVVMFF